VIVATGARPRALRLNGEAADGIVDAWRVIAGQVNVGKNVVVHDWRSDWIGPGVAELLAARGCYVRLTTSGSHVGEMLQQYVRDLTAGRLHTLGVPVYPYTHLAGFEDGTVYAQHAVTGAPVVVEDAETLVICGMHEAQCDIDLEGLDCDIRWAGDCVAPRTVEEAVYEGLLAGEAV
jgi:pyruvate/2-oxoglutarate dehydrogenase complex dihydrolipoamide dehydrogenase (E3) component